MASSCKAKDIVACSTSGNNNTNTNINNNKNQVNLQDKKPNLKDLSGLNFEKVIEKRVLFGSRRRDPRKVSSHAGARLLPSRLSKVSLADDPAD